MLPRYVCYIYNIYIAIIQLVTLLDSTILSIKKSWSRSVVGDPLVLGSGAYPWVLFILYSGTLLMCLERSHCWDCQCVCWSDFVGHRSRALPKKDFFPFFICLSKLASNTTIKLSRHDTPCIVWLHLALVWASYMGKINIHFSVIHI